jgi:chorismate mutase
VPVRAIRGATQVEVDEKEHVLALTRELVTEVLTANELTNDDVISMVFSATKDIASIAPAAAARQLGLNDTALLCVQEMHVDGSLPLMVRLIAHVETQRPRELIQNVYQRGTHVLRTDIEPMTPITPGAGAEPA